MCSAKQEALWANGAPYELIKNTAYQYHYSKLTDIDTKNDVLVMTTPITNVIISTSHYKLFHLPCLVWCHLFPVFLS